jgi:hypothetical protein
MKSYVATKPCTYKDLALKAGDVVQVDDAVEVKHFALKPLTKKDEVKEGRESYEVPKTPVHTLGDVKEANGPYIRRP